MKLLVTYESLTKKEPYMIIEEVAIKNRCFPGPIKSAGEATMYNVTIQFHSWGTEEDLEHVASELSEFDWATIEKIN